MAEQVQVVYSTTISAVQTIHAVPGEKVIILVGHSIGHSTQKKCICTCVRFRQGSEIELFHVIARIKERQDALRRGTRHVLTRVAKCTDVDGGIFENL
jgi:hypothetical protein